MKDPNAKNNSPLDPKETFTIDSDTSQIENSSTEMPSLTKLLNRKTLGTMTKKAPPPSISPSPETISNKEFSSEIIPPPLKRPLSQPSTPSSTLQTPSPVQSPPKQSSSSQSTLLKIQPIRRKTKNTIQPLHIWTFAQLKTGKDPLGQGIILLLEKGAKSALFLTVSTTTDESKAPLFQSSAIVRGNSQIGLWTGLRWDPNLVPETWNVFLKLGFVELTPPSAETNIQSNRNVIRTAFGITSEEYLLLVRVGPLTSMRGVVAFISTKSIATELPKAMALLFSPKP